jgi:hypothetical protein
MMARSFGSLCSLLLVWLCALGAEPARHPVVTRAAARSVEELALRDVAEAPRLAPRASATSVATPRFAERSAPTVFLALPAERFARLSGVALTTRTALGRQAAAHAARPRWRAYDAAAPPEASPSSR